MDELAHIEVPAALSAILSATTATGFDMASEPRTGALLRTLAASKPGGKFLELGTGTGLATAWLLDGLDAQATLVSVDVDARMQEVARTHLHSDPRLTLVTEDGLRFLRRQQPSSFDFLFADAMPGKYEGLDEALRVLKPSGFYVVDDMLPQANWPEGHADKVPVLLNALSKNTSLSIVPLAWASGLVLAVKR